LTGRVVSHRANFVRVRVPNGGGSTPETSELLCVKRQLLRKMKRSVLVGDNVQVASIDWSLGHGVVETVLPRKSQFQNPPVANVELALVMFSLASPPIEPQQVNRFLVTAEAARLPLGVTVVLNKVDLVEDEVVQSWIDRLNRWGYRALPVSAEKGIGVPDVCHALENKLGVVVGPSGVGKSSLINAVNAVEGGLVQLHDVAQSQTETDGDLSRPYDVLDVGQVSSRTGRGKHTTRNISLIRLSNGGFLADTPGFSQPSLVGLNSKTLPECFPEIRSRLIEGTRNGGQGCGFADCAHVHEPDCIVRGDWERYPFYVDLLGQVKVLESQALKAGAKKESRESTVRVKTAEGGKTVEEPKLDRKKHRRTSRKLTKQQFKQTVLEDFRNDEHQ